MTDDIKKQIELADKCRDINDINKDIEEGQNHLKNSSLYEKNKYINKIESKYKIYIDVIKSIMNMRTKIYGSSSTRKMTVDEIISQDVDILVLIRDKKLYEELEKVLKDKNEKFRGGINVE